MLALYSLVNSIISIYVWVVIAWVILSWLLAFDVVNRSNRLVYAINDFLNRLVEPAMRRIQKHIPSFNGIDLSPMILILALWFVKMLMFEYWYLPIVKG